jgi:uncharacterized protein (DUF1697 family)
MSNPFLVRRKLPNENLYVTFLEKEPAQGSMDKLFIQKTSEHEFTLIGKEIYLYCPGGYAKTKYSNNYFEKGLKTIATTRNWNTVNKIYQMANQPKSKKHNL